MPYIGGKFPFYFLLYTREESTWFAKIVDFRFSMDLHVLRCPEHDLTIFRKCLSVCRSVCLSACILYIFLRIQWYFWFYLSVDFLHRIKANLVGKFFFSSKYVGYMQVLIEHQRALLYYDTFSSNLVICLIFFVSSSIQ